MDTIQVRFYCHKYNTDLLNKFTDLSELLRAYELQFQLSADLLRELEFVSTIHYDA
jgi:hypothetical protein